jgi:predicted flap endonuclease-1-like 5' DNA nuclease
MSGSIIQVGILLIAAIAAGGAIGWMLRSLRGKQQLETLHDEWQVKFADATRQRDKFHSEGNKLRRAVESQKALLKKHESAASSSRTEIESLREKQKSMSKDLFALGAERDEAKKQLAGQQQALISAKHQIADLQAEFANAGKLYKGELAKALEVRTSLEAKLTDSKAEEDSLANLLEAAKVESQSVNKMLAAAQSRLDNLDELESKAISLEAENAELRHEASRVQQQIEALQRGIAELEELKVQNRELSHCLKSMENSRKQYEIDAKRYREQADQSEKQSETLRIKLDDVEKNLAAMAKQHEEAQKHVREQVATAGTNGKTPPAPVIDDLTEIVGIGKVFQNTLHKLGVYSFKQIASFGPADIARVNVALKENRGRMEQDDWIGQAKELFYKKYSERVEH